MGVLLDARTVAKRGFQFSPVPEQDRTAGVQNQRLGRAASLIDAYEGPLSHG
jgi:hypothetical protein